MLCRILNKERRRPYIWCLLPHLVLWPVVIYLILPFRFACRYNKYINTDDIYDALVPDSNKNVSLFPLESCDYRSIIEENLNMHKWQYFEQLLHSEEIRPGGKYRPIDCRARFSTAIIVPYRQREKQLHDFLIYMHNFLRRQRIHYRIFLVEQYDKKPFNRAKLMNIGAVIASQRYKYECLILHDVDLLPFNLGNIYACSKQPRHMSAAISKFRFNLPYCTIFGGVISMRWDTFLSINGMSNSFEGWGGEDDDLSRRLQEQKISFVRFPQDHSEYNMFTHKKETPNNERYKLLDTFGERHKTDGLRTLNYTIREVRIHSLFTHILAET